MINPKFFIENFQTRMKEELYNLKNPAFGIEYGLVIDNLRTPPTDYWVDGNTFSMVYEYNGETLQIDLVKGKYCYSDCFGERVKIGFAGWYVNNELSRFYGLASKKYVV